MENKNSYKKMFKIKNNKWEDMGKIIGFLFGLIVFSSIFFYILSRFFNILNFKIYVIFITLLIIICSIVIIMKKFRKFAINSVKYLFSLVTIVIILLFILEISSLIFIKIYYAEKPDPNLDSLHNKILLEGKKETEMEWYPYLGYRRKPYDGEYIHILDGGIRKTTNPCSNASSLKIFMFGGSTMWSTAVSDENTVPSLLSKYLCKNDLNVEITNFGEMGYVSTQETFTLILELQKGNMPDIVIFYDGINDIWSAYQNNVAGTPENIFKRKFEFGSYDDYKIHSLNLMKIIRYIVSPPYLYLGEPDMNHDIINIYLANIKVIKSLEEEYGFKAFFFWQPSLFSKNELSESENEILMKEDKALKMIFESTNPLFETMVKNESINIFDISNIFNNNPNTIYYYDSIHLLEDGNQIIAEEFGKKITDSIKKTEKKVVMIK